MPTLRTSAPSWPSWAHQRNVASYVWLIKCIGDPVFCAPNLPRAVARHSLCSALRRPAATTVEAGFKPPEDLFASVDMTPERLVGRRELLVSLNGKGDSIVQQRRNGRTCSGRAFELASSSTARRAFEVDREDPKVRDRYGRHPLGQNLLLARRLVEAGVGFVTVNGWTGISPNEKLGGPPSSSWDMHGSNMGMGNAFGDGSFGMGWCLPRLDEACPDC